MKSRVLLVGLVVGFVLISGCTTEKEAVKLYECPTGQLVEDISKCPKKSTTTVNPTTSIQASSSILATTTIDTRIRELEEQVKRLETQFNATMTSMVTITTTLTPSTIATTTLEEWSSCCFVEHGCDSLGSVEASCGSDYFAVIACKGMCGDYNSQSKQQIRNNLRIVCRGECRLDTSWKERAGDCEDDCKKELKECFDECERGWTSYSHYKEWERWG